MPRIPRSERTVRLPLAPRTGAPISPALAARPGQALADAGRELGRVAREAADIEVRQRQKTDAVTVAKSAAEARAEWARQLIERSENAPDGAPDFTANVMTDFDNDVVRRLEAAPESARPFLDARLAQLRGTIESRALRLEGSARAAKRRRDLQQTSNLAANAVRTDDAQFEAALGEAEGAIAAMQLPEAQDKAARQVAREAITKAMFQGLNERDPERAKEMLESGRFDAALGGSKNQLVNDNQVELRRREREKRVKRSEERARIRNTYADAVAEVRATGRFTNSLSFASIRANFSEEEAGELIGRLEAEREAFVARQEVSLNNPAEDRALLEANKPAGENFRAENARFKLLQATIADKQRRLRADNAGYVLQENQPLGRELQTALQNNDATGVRNYLSKLDDMQARLGIQPAARRVLPKTVATFLVGEINSQAQAVDRANRIGQLEDLFGAAWTRVAGELQDAGLTQGATVLASMDGATQRVARVQMAEAMDVGRTDLRKAIGTEAAGEVDDNVIQSTREFALTLQDVPDGGRVLVEFRQGVQLLAYKYVAGGASAADAARQAADDVINSRYAFDGTLRIPRAAFPDESNPGRIVETVQAARNEVVGTLGNLEIIPPPSVFPLTSDQLQQDYAAALVANHKWIVNGDETGIILMDALGNVPLQRVRDAVGNEIAVPIEIRFAQLQAREGEVIPPSPVFRIERGARQAPGERATETDRGQQP